MAQHKEINYSNPFVGLRPFEDHEDILFFGRDQQIHDLLTKLHATNLVGVVGGSGSGKSSLIKAGLIPVLKSGVYKKPYKKWEVISVRPGDKPLTNLIKALDKKLNFEVELENDRSREETIRNHLLSEGPDYLFPIISNFTKSTESNLFILFDQFEELWRYHENKIESAAERDGASNIEKKKNERSYNIERSEFVQVMLALSQQVQLHTTVVLTMRSEYIGNCTEFRDLPEAMNKSQYLVPNLFRKGLRMTIEGPIKLYRASISSELVTTIINDLGNEDDKLPLLQHAMMRVWENFRKRTSWNEDIIKKNQIPKETFEIIANDYTDIGSIKYALSNHANEVFDSLKSKIDQSTCKKLFQRLTEKKDDGRVIRQPASEDNIKETLLPEEYPSLNRVIHSFSCEGVSFVYKSKDGNLDISHESLTRNWDRLIKWIDEEYKAKEKFYSLHKSSVNYLDQNKKKVSFLTGLELENFIKWRKEFDPNKGWWRRYETKEGQFDGSIKFLEKSQRKDQIREIRNIIVVLLAVGAGIYFLSLLNTKEALKEAEDQKEIAEIQKGIAEEQTRLATSAKEEAEQQREFALQQQQRAQIQANRAAEQAELATREAARAEREAATTKEKIRKLNFVLKINEIITSEDWISNLDRKHQRPIAEFLASSTPEKSYDDQVSYDFEGEILDSATYQSLSRSFRLLSKANVIKNRNPTVAMTLLNQSNHSYPDGVSRSMFNQSYDALFKELFRKAIYKQRINIQNPIIALSGSANEIRALTRLGEHIISFDNFKVQIKHYEDSSGYRLENISDPIYSKSGNYLFFTSDTDYYLTDLRTGHQKQLNLSKYYSYDPIYGGFSQDESKVVLASEFDGIQIFEIGTGQITSISTDIFDDGVTIKAVRFFGDNKLLIKAVENEINKGYDDRSNSSTFLFDLASNKLDRITNEGILISMREGYAKYILYDNEKITWKNKDGETLNDIDLEMVVYDGENLGASFSRSKDYFIVKNGSSVHIWKNVKQAWEKVTRVINTPYDDYYSYDSYGDYGLYNDSYEIFIIESRKLVISATGGYLYFWDLDLDVSQVQSKGYLEPLSIEQKLKYDLIDVNDITTKEDILQAFEYYAKKELFEKQLKLYKNDFIEWESFSSEEKENTLVRIFQYLNQGRSDQIDYYDDSALINSFYEELVLLTNDLKKMNMQDSNRVEIGRSYFLSSKRFDNEAQPHEADESLALNIVAILKPGYNSNEYGLGIKDWLYHAYEDLVDIEIANGNYQSALSYSDLGLQTIDDIVANNSADYSDFPFTHPEMYAKKVKVLLLMGRVERAEREFQTIQRRYRNTDRTDEYQILFYEVFSNGVSNQATDDFMAKNNFKGG